MYSYSYLLQLSFDLVISWLFAFKLLLYFHNYSLLYSVFGNFHVNKRTFMNCLVKIASVLSCRLAKESPSLLQHCLTPRWILSFSEMEDTLDMLLGPSSENSLWPGPTRVECGQGL